MARFTIRYRLPLFGAPRAVFESDYGLRGGRLLVRGVEVLSAATKEELTRGVNGWIEGGEHAIRMRLPGDADDAEVVVELDGCLLVREDRVAARRARSVWIHGWVALGASFFGFVAGYLYLIRSEVALDPWSLKMAIHMAAWHLLLTLTLFPASVFGQRFGIRVVQGVSAVFFAIHVAIALANVSESFDGPWIALFNAASGALFGAAVVYGIRAHRDMDPFRTGAVTVS